MRANPPLLPVSRVGSCRTRILLPLASEKPLRAFARQDPGLDLGADRIDQAHAPHALLHTLTGHLCLSTLHANNSYHALSRIINMFPYDARSGLLSDLSIGLRAIISQRLVRNKEGELVPAVEILLNTSLIAELIKNGEITQIKEAMEQSLYPGSQTFEQALCKLFLDGNISFDEALIASDSPTNLAWLVNQNTPSTKQAASTDPDDPSVPMTSGLSKLEIDPEFLNRHQ